MNRQTENETQIKALLDQKIKAIYNKDMEGILAMYTDDVVTFDLKDPLQNAGTGTIKNRLREWFISYQSEINQEYQKLEVYAGDSVAFSHCLTRTYGTSIKGEQQDMWYRTTNGFKKIDNKWLITHEHVSEPIDMNTGMAMFDLKP